MDPASRDNLAQLKLSGALVRLDALQPAGFTAQELSDAARVELETARSFLKKESSFATVVPEVRAPAASGDGRGRPANLYLLSASRRVDLIERLAAIRQEIDLAEGIARSSGPQLFGPLASLEETLAELEGTNDTPEEWRDRLEEARLEFASASADCRALLSKKAPEATEFSKRLTELQDRLALMERRWPPSNETAADQGFDIEIERWEKTGHADAAVRLTAASIRISAADKVPTRNTAPWLKSVRDSASLAAYPLALWLAKSWWRLRWEPAAIGLAKASWRTAHELAFAAGDAFDWPPLVIGSQGENLFAVCRPDEDSTSSGVRYLDSFRASISAAEFERAADKFVEQTIARLKGLDDLELSVLWDKLSADRADPGRASYRRVEALLGFDPDEASTELIGTVKKFLENVDPLAVTEIVSAFGTSRDDLNTVISRANNVMYDHGAVNGRVFRASLQDIDVIKAQPWERGRRLAGQCRKALGFGLEPIDNKKLGELLGLTSEQMSDKGLAVAQGLPFGVAIRDADCDNTSFLFRRTVFEERRFEAARFIADLHLSPPECTWILETDTKTDRQKAQRAFAVEFLMPFNGVREYTGDDFSDESLEKAACYYEASQIAAHRQAHNNKAQILAAA